MLVAFVVDFWKRMAFHSYYESMYVVFETPVSGALR